MTFIESTLPTKAEFEASLLLPDVERAKLERDTKAAAETMMAAMLAKAEAAAARASEVSPDPNPYPYPNPNPNPNPNPDPDPDPSPSSNQAALRARCSRGVSSRRA